MEKNARPQKETWKVFGSDEVLEDKNLIEYYQLHQFDEKLNNRLLGEFTGEGAYVLPDEIKKTLVKVKKLIIHSSENSYLAETVIKTRGIRFLIKYWAVDDKGVANLYFIEHLDGEEMQTFVAQYIGEKDESFLVRMKGAFNLQNDVDEFEDQYLEDLETQYSILERQKAERDFVVELQSEFYLYEILAVLKEQGGEAGKKIANQIEIEIEEKKQLTNKEGLYTNARLKMDKMILAAGGFKQLGQKIPQLPKLVQNYTKPVKDYDDISKRLDAMKPPSDEVAPKQGGAAKKSGGSANKKGGSTKKGGGGSSNKAKKSGKKEDKKASKDKKQDVLLGGSVVKDILKNVTNRPNSEQKVVSEARKKTSAIIEKGAALTQQTKQESNISAKVKNTKIQKTKKPEIKKRDALVSIGTPQPTVQEGKINPLGGRRFFNMGTVEGRRLLEVDAAEDDLSKKNVVGENLEGNIYFNEEVSTKDRFFSKRDSIESTLFSL